MVSDAKKQLENLQYIKKIFDESRRDYEYKVRRNKHKSDMLNKLRSKVDK
jgi:hypothetical protein